MEERRMVVLDEGRVFRFPELSRVKFHLKTGVIVGSTKWYDRLITFEELQKVVNDNSIPSYINDCAYSFILRKERGLQRCIEDYIKRTGNFSPEEINVVVHVNATEQFDCGDFKELSRYYHDCMVWNDLQGFAVCAALF